MGTKGPWTKSINFPSFQPIVDYMGSVITISAVFCIFLPILLFSSVPLLLLQ